MVRRPSLPFLVVAAWFAFDGREVRAQTEDAATRNARQLRQLAKYIGMPWVADGKLQSTADPSSAAAAALGMEFDDPVLQRAALRYAAISIVYARGLELYRGRPAEIGDLPALVKAFVAGMTDDEDAKVETMVTLLKGVVVANERMRQGGELLAAATSEHAAIWASLANAIDAAAGPVPPNGAPAITVAAVVGDERSTGLRFRNDSKVTMHDVVLVVDSTMTTAEQSSIPTHTVFVPEWLPRGEILLPPRLMPGASRGSGGAVTYRLFARELRCPEQTASLAATGTPVGDGGGAPVVLPLGRAESAPKAVPATTNVDPKEASLEQATAWLDQPDLTKAKTAFEQLEAKLTATTTPDPVVLSVVRYRLAEVLRLRGFAAARTSDDDETAKKLLVLATRKYDQVVEAPDVETPREGKSLRAAALHRLVHVDAILCQGYRALAKQRPKEKSPATNAKKHESAVRKNLTVLEETYANVADTDGRTHLEAARELVRQLLAQ